MQEFTLSDIKSLILAISNHIMFLCKKKVISTCFYEFDTSIISIRNDPEEEMFEYIDLFFLKPIRDKIDQAKTIKEHKELLEELKFITEEIKVIVNEFFEIKEKAKEQYNKEYSFGIDKILKGGVSW